MLKRRIVSHLACMFYRRKTFLQLALRSLGASYAVLDLGCGKQSPLSIVGGAYKVGVDLYSPFLSEARANRTHDEYILADVMTLPFKAKSFDAVVCLDLLEHLTKKEGVILLRIAEVLAKRRIILLTPNGYVPQQESEGNPLQRHKSGWIVEDFIRSGFRVFGIKGLRHLRGEACAMEYRPYILWSIISGITENIVWHHPYFAYHLLCIKELAEPAEASSINSRGPRAQ